MRSVSHSISRVGESYVIARVFRATASRAVVVAVSMPSVRLSHNHTKFMMTAHTRRGEPCAVPKNTLNERLVPMTADYFSPDNVLVVTFGEDPENDKNAYQALTDLKQLDSQDQIKIAGAAVVTRDGDGRVDVKSDVGEDPYAGTASGGLIGLLIGIIGGPLGMLVGGAYGMLVGSLFDIDEVDTTESVLGEISKQVQPTRTAVLAQVTEQSPEIIDAAMARLDGEVLRRPAVDVEQEIAAAEEAQRKAKHEARKELHKARVEKTKADAHAKVEEMKTKLRRPKAGASS
jgi:uncharacterized membrane protein